MFYIIECISRIIKVIDCKKARWKPEIKRNLFHVYIAYWVIKFPINMGDEIKQSENGRARSSKHEI